MKKFLFYLTTVLFILIITAIILDVVYTSVYLQSRNRNKIDQVNNLKNIKYDVIILGSSRANNHFVSEMFQKKGLKTYNYGMSGSSIFETSLMLKLMIKNKWVIKNLILDADLNLRTENQTSGISSLFLPYIHTSEITREHFCKQDNFNEIYYIPFYRYMKYEVRIGFREMFMNAIHKKTSDMDNWGYSKLDGVEDGNMKNDFSDYEPISQNKYYEEIKNICKINNINFIPLMTPVCSNTIGMDYFDKVKKAYPEIHNYENAVIEDKYFSSCGHMNDAGARIFTAKIIEDFFSK